MLGIGDLLDRRPASLSGGEAQRVAIAAALMRSPDLVLMDEPLASLDRKRRDELLPYFDRLHEELSLPVIYVSHDIEEISRLCDHLVLLDAGRVAASGKLVDVLSRVDTPVLSGRNAGVVIWASPVDQEDGSDEVRFRGRRYLGARRVSRRAGARCACGSRQVTSVFRATGRHRRRSSMYCARHRRNSCRGQGATALVRLGVGNQVCLPR